MGVIVSAGDGAVVDVGGPEVGVAGVVGEVADGITEVFVAGPAKPDGAHLAGLACGGRDTGQAHQCFGGGESGAAVTDFGQQPGSADGSRAGQAGEDVRVDGGAKLLTDLLLQEF